MLEQLVQVNPIPAFEAGLCAMLSDLGRGHEAAERVERAVDRGFDDVPLNQVYLTTLVMWARAATDVGSERAAGRLYELIEPWRTGMVWNGATGYGSAESYLGMCAATLGAHDRAREHFAAASRLHDREGVAGWEALSLCYAAKSLHAAGAMEESRDTAVRALALARDKNHVLAVRRAEALLQLTPHDAARR
jgi:hypothetical protein